MTKTLALVLFLVSTTLFVFLFDFSFFQESPVFAQGQIDLTASKKVKDKGTYLKYVFPVQAPSQFNFIGLSGYVSISSNTSTFYQALISIQNVPSGNCPPSGTVFGTYGQMIQQYPGVHPISAFNLKGVGRGKVEVPTDFTFPIKVPITGCIFVLLDGGEIMKGDAVTMESHMFLIYDTEPAPSPAPYFIQLDYEFCYKQPGCFLWTKQPKAQNAFAQVIKIDSPLYLWSLSGDVSTGTFTSPWAEHPKDQWSTTFDYYLYKSCPPPPIGSSGPLDYYRQIPADADNLLSFQFQGDGKGSFHQSTIKVFEPKLIEPGNCFVNLARSVADDDKGGISDESQIYALVQPVPPSFTIQGYKLGCPEGTEIKLDGAKETTEQPYFFHNVPVGSHTVSLELPQDAPAYDISYSPCDCCINHPDKSFVSGSSFTFFNDTVDPPDCEATWSWCNSTTDCNWYDLWWQCKRKGDLNNDGQVNSQDLKILLENWGAALLQIADLNDDDQVNGLDFGKMLSLLQ